jgi:hypothetical protein
MKFSAIFCAQLIVSAVALSMNGAAQAQDPVRTEPAAGFIYISDIGCVDGTPAPPITNSCPSTSANGAYAAAPAPTRVKAHAKRKNTVQNTVQ